MLLSTACLGQTDERLHEMVHEPGEEEGDPADHVPHEDPAVAAVRRNDDADGEHAGRHVLHEEGLRPEDVDEADVAAAGRLDAAAAGGTRLASIWRNVGWISLEYTGTNFSLRQCIGSRSGRIQNYSQDRE